MSGPSLQERVEKLEAKAEGNQGVLDALVVFHKSLNEIRDRLDRLDLDVDRVVKLGADLAEEVVRIQKEVDRD